MRLTYVIVGNSAAAVGAIEGIRSLDVDNPITIVSEEFRHTYARPLISYHLAGKVSEENMAYRPLDFYKKNNARALLGHKAVKLDTVRRIVTLSTGDKINYEKLLLATGSRPAMPVIPGLKKPNVFLFYTLDHSLRLREYCRYGMKAVVLGAGLTALKAAEALVSLGVDVTLVVRSKILRNFLDDNAALLIARHLEASGVHLVSGSEPAEISGEPAASRVHLADGRILPCNLVVCATGIEPNTSLAAGTLLKVSEGILVDQGMRTNLPSIFAAGDVAQAYDLLLDKERVIPLLPVAYAQGETAGRNMAGGSAVYAGMSMNAVSFFGLPVISAGIIRENNSEEAHIFLDEEKIIYRKLVFWENRLRGFILVNAIDRAGILTWLIREQVDVSQFKSNLISGCFSYASLPAKLRRQQFAL